MKPSSSIIECDEEGSTLDAQHDTFPILAEPQQQVPVEPVLSSNHTSQPPKMHPATDLNTNQQTTKQQAWFQSSVIHRAESYIEAQVLQLTEDCRLFRDDEDEEQPEHQNSTSNHHLALFRRNEIQTTWSMLGNGAFSEVYAIQKIDLLDTGFVDAQQQEARRVVQSSIQQQQHSQVPLLPMLQSRSIFGGGSLSTPSMSSSSSLGNGQFVIKHLRRDLLATKKKFIHAAGDLVLEAMYLSKLKHPNIITLRGCAVGGPNAYEDGKHDGFFLILDRLDATLSQQIHEWERGHTNSGISRPQQLLPTSSSSSLPQPLASVGKTPNTCAVYSKDLVDFEERIDIAYQVGLALEYLHSRDIIFRDLKPDNIGLIYRPGNKPLVQLFDFGLCRELPEASPKEQSVFHMSGVGTRRYMAPEVFLGLHYNVKADVYSWTMVLHAMLSLQRPFEMYDAQLHKQLVCIDGLRPTIFHGWPEPIQDVLKSGWAVHSNDRPRMGQICTTLQGMQKEIDTIKKTTTIPTITNSTATTGMTTPRPFTSSSSNSVEENKWQEGSGCRSNTSSSVQEAFVSLIDSWTSTLCVGTMYNHPSNKSTKNLGAPTATKPTSTERYTKRNLLRKLEAHLVADTAGTHLLLRERIGTADYPQLMHLRSSYL